jgi:hypothetical protein
MAKRFDFDLARTERALSSTKGRNRRDDARRDAAAAELCQQCVLSPLRTLVGTTQKILLFSLSNV